MFTHTYIGNVPSPNSEPPRMSNHKGSVGVWIVDTSQQQSLGYMEVVPACIAAILLPIIQAHVAGTIVHSDE